MGVVGKLVGLRALECGIVLSLQGEVRLSNDAEALRTFHTGQRMQIGERTTHFREPLKQSIANVCMCEKCIYLVVLCILQCCVTVQS